MIIAGGRKYRFTLADIQALDRLRAELPIEEVISGGAGRTYLWSREHRGQWEEWYPRDSEVPFPDLRRVVPGSTVGADLCAVAWAVWRGIDYRWFLADWNRYKNAAGPRRNREMARSGAEACVLFPGGAGTASMHAEATREGLRVIDWRQGVQ